MPTKSTLSKLKKKLERARLADERKQKALSDYIKRELKYGEINRKKHEKEWRELTMKCAIQEIRTNLEYTWQRFDCTLDIKDYTISLLMDELKDINDQFIMKTQNHCSRVDGFIMKMREDLRMMNEDHRKTLKQMEISHENLMKEQTAKYTNKTDYLKSELNKIEQIRDDIRKNRITFLYLENEFKEQEEDKNRNKLIIIGVKIDEIWKKQQETLDEYFSKQNEFKQQTEKENISIENCLAETKKYSKRINNLSDLIRKLNSKLKFLDETEGRKLRNLQKNEKLINGFLLILKNKVHEDTKLDYAKRKLMVARSMETLAYLEDIVRRGCLLLGVRRANRRYETLEEKVMPYPITQSHSYYRTRENKRMNLFYQKMAIVETSRMALAEEKCALVLENYNLARMMSKYCRCMTCQTVLEKLWERAKSRLKKTKNGSQDIVPINKKIEGKRSEEITKKTKEETKLTLPKITETSTTFSFPFKISENSTTQHKFIERKFNKTSLKPSEELTPISSIYEISKEKNNGKTRKTNYKFSFSSKITTLPKINNRKTNQSEISLFRIDYPPSKMSTTSISIMTPVKKLTIPDVLVSHKLS